MANFSGKFLKVWEVKEDNGYIKLDLGDSRKNKDGEYDNCTWFGCLLLGEAAKKDIRKDDVIEITSGQIFQRKYNDKWYIDVKIWHLTVDEEKRGSAPAKKDFPTPPDFGGGKKDDIYSDDVPF